MILIQLKIKIDMKKQTALKLLELLKLIVTSLIGVLGANAIS